MKKKKSAALAAAAFLLAAWGAAWVHGGMGAAEVVRKLSGLRMSLALYAMDHGGKPASFGDTIRSGSLEDAPPLKLPGHFRRSSVRDVRTFAITDTGGWAYVNDPKDPSFGLLFIDCSHKDEKGRYWSEF